MKRFSETNKWKDEWFLLLTPTEKLVFIFCCEFCDNAGFLDKSPRLNSFLIGITEIEFLDACKGLARGLIESKDKNKIWVKNFLFHQKNIPLNLENNAHKQIISIIKMNIDLFSYDFSPLIGANLSPIGIGKGKGNDKGKSNDEEKNKIFTPPTEKEVIAYFLEKGYTEYSAKKAFQYYDSAKWVDSKGSKIKNWKQKMVGVWFKDENKQSSAPVSKQTSAPDYKSFIGD
jgi:hypothetical protein